MTGLRGKMEPINPPATEAMALPTAMAVNDM